MGSIKKLKARLASPPAITTVDHPVDIGPDEAQLLLDTQQKNRNPNQARIEKYRASMERGRWLETGDSIRLSKNGLLLDGQNRLIAIKREGVTLPFIVVWGLDDRAQDYMDIGGARTLAQALSLRGEKSPTALSAAVRLIFQVQNGDSPNNWVTEYNYEEYGEMIDADPLIHDATMIGGQVQRYNGVPGSPVAAAYWSAAQKDQNDADDFFTDLWDMSATVPKDSPILALRETMLRMAKKKRGGMSRKEQGVLFDVCVRAFNDYRANKAVPNPYRPKKLVRTWTEPK